MNFNLIPLTLVLFSISSTLPYSSSQDINSLTQQYGGLISQGLGAVSNAAKQGGEGGPSGLQNLIQSATKGKAECVQKLLPCQKYFKELTSDQVPESCCEPLREVVEDNTECLCGVIKSEGLLKTVNVTLDDAVNVAKTCGAETDLSVCENGSPTPSPAPAPEPEPAIQFDSLTKPASTPIANSPTPTAPTGDESGGHMEKSSLIVMVLTFMLLAL